MANTIRARGKYGKYYYIDSSSSSDVLTMEEMESNAKYFALCAKDKYPLWSINAIAAMLGNIQSEGILNPSQWEYGRDKDTQYGYGLVQWTPATKFLDWAAQEGLSRTSIDAQVERISWEYLNDQQWIETELFPISFADFLVSDSAPQYLASAWLYNYERPGDPAATEAKRKEQALFWYSFLEGIEYTAKRMPVWMYPAFRNNY